MVKVLRQRNFGLLWSAGLISMIGDWVLFISLPIYTYNLTQSTLATGIMFMVGTLPRVLLGSLAGVYVDRWDRQRTMVVADLSRAVLILLLLLSVLPNGSGSSTWCRSSSRSCHSSLVRLRMRCCPSSWMSPNW